MKYVPLKEIRVEELIAAGYREDKSAERRYKYRARIIIGVGLIAFIAGMVLVRTSAYAGLGMFVICGAGCWLFFGCIIVHLIRPKTTEMYLNLSVLHPRVSSQMLYVCPESKTFFKGALTVRPGL